MIYEGGESAGGFGPLAGAHRRFVGVRCVVVTFYSDESCKALVV